MSGSWGASFGSGMWGALDREARDFQARRIARKEEERRKRLAEEERLRQEALANQRAENLFEMNNQSMEPMYAATGMAGMAPYVSGAIQKVFDQAGANGSTVGGIMNAQQDILNKKAYDDQMEKEAEHQADRDYLQDQRNYNKKQWEQSLIAAEEARALKPKLEAEAEAEKALKKNREAALFDAQLNNLRSQANYHNAQANYWNNGGRSAYSKGKVQEEIDPEEQKFLDNEKDFNRQLQDLDRDIERLNGDARGYESDSFDKADAAKRDANALRDRRKEIIKKRDSNRSEYQKWKASKNKPAAKTGSSPVVDFAKSLLNIVNGIGNRFEKTKEQYQKLTKIQEDSIKAERERDKQRLAEEARKSTPVSDYDRGIQERGELYGNIGRSIGDFFSRGKKAVSDYFEGSKKAYAEQKAIEALKNPEKAQLDAVYNQGKISRAEYMRKLSVLNGL